jgi:putative membrane protein
MRARMFSKRVVCGLSLLAALQVGCSDDDDVGSVGDGGGGGNRPDAGLDASTRSDGGLDASGPGVDAEIDGAIIVLTEAQVVGVAAAINAGEINAGMVAQTKAVSAAAKDYAAMMITMHTATQQRQTALGIAPAASTEQQAVMAMAADALQSLQSLPAGLMFDNAYLQSQVSMHQSALLLIDQILLPSSSTAALRDELTRTRGEVAAHLVEARELYGDAGIDNGAITTDAGLDAGG